MLIPACARRILAEYVAASPGSSVAEAVQLLSGAPLLRMVHTRHGAQLACDVISYGSAKDRKKAVKAMAGQVMKMALDEWAHVVLICTLDKVDDTALLKKTILPELQVRFVPQLWLPTLIGLTAVTALLRGYDSMTITVSTGGLIS